MQRKIISIILSVLMIVSLMPSFSVLAYTHASTITVTQANFGTAENTAAMSATVNQTFPGASGQAVLQAMKAGQTGSCGTEAWTWNGKGVQMNKHRFAKITYYYKTTAGGLGGATGKNMKLMVGIVSDSAGNAKLENGRWYGASFTSRDTIVADQEDSVIIDFSSFYTANKAAMDASPWINYLFQAKWYFFGMDNNSTSALNQYDQMYIKQVEFFSYDPEAVPTFSPVTVTYDAGTGTGTPITGTATANQTFTLPQVPADFANGGKTFGGWAYNGTTYAAGATATFYDDTDVTISAVWPVNITYTAGAGTGTPLTENATLYKNFTFPSMPADFTNGTMKFSGWKYKGMTYIPGATANFYDNADITIEPVWTSGKAYVKQGSTKVTGGETPFYDTLEKAIAGLGYGGGTIYIEGEYKWTATVSFPATTRNLINIKGYNDSATGNILWTNKKMAQFSVNGGDVVIDNITLKNQGADETSWFTNGYTLTFGPGIAYDATTTTFLDGTTTKSGSEKHWLGVNSSAPGTNKLPNIINVQSEALKTSVIAPIQGYGAQFALTGHTVYNISAGTHNALIGTTRDGYSLSNGGKIYGDVTFNLSGGTYGGIYTAGLSGKSFHYGNYLLHITGGIFNSTINFGGNTLGTTGGANASVSGHQAIVVDLKEYQASSTDTDGFTIADLYLSKVSCGKRIVILNNYEQNSVANKVTVNAAPEYKIQVTGGKAMPAFTPSSTSTSSAKQGDLNGFYLTPDDAAKTAVYVNNALIDSSKYNQATGVYDLSSYESTTVPIQISFDLPPEATSTVSFDKNSATATGTVSNIIVAVGDPIVLPANGFTNAGFEFAGWQYDGVTYLPGQSIPAAPSTDITVKALWEDVSAVETIYLDNVNGNDLKTGTSEANAVKTWARAYAVTKNAGTNDGGTIKVISNIGFAGFIGSATTNMVTIEGKTGTEVLSVTSQANLYGPTTFRNITFSNNQYQFINTYDHKVIFDTGITKASGSPASIGIHAGVNGDASATYNSTGIDVTINSGVFQAIIVGGAYLKDTDNIINGDTNITVNGGTVSGIYVTTDYYNTAQKGVTFNGDIFININGGTVGNMQVDTAEITTGVPKVTAINGNYQVIVNSAATAGTVTLPTSKIAAGYSAYSVKSGANGLAEATTTAGVLKLTTDKSFILINNVNTPIAENSLYTISAGTTEILYGVQSFELSYSLGTTGTPQGTVPSTTSVYSGSAITTAALGDITNDGYTFLGWEDADGKVYAAGGSFTMPEANAVLTAKWWDPATDMLVYVDSVNGNDANTGYSMASAKQTLAAAYTALTQKGTIYLAGQFTPGTLPTKAFKVTLTSFDTANKAKLLIAANLASYFNSSTDVIDVVYSAGSNSHNNLTSILYMKDVTGLPMMHVGPLGTGVVNNDITLTYENIITATPMTIGGAYIKTGASINGNVYVNLINSSVGIINFGADSYGAASNGFVGGNITGNVRIFAEGNSTIASTSLRNGSYATANDSMISIGGATELVLSNGASVTGDIVMPDTHAAGGNWVVKAASGVNVQKTDTIGTYRFVHATASYIAVVDEATNITKFYATTADVTLPAGSYKVFGSDVTFTENPDTHEITLDFNTIPTPPPAQNKLFLGFYNNTQGKFITPTDKTYGATDEIAARYVQLVTDTKSADVNFQIIGTQIRASSGDIPQGLRFVTEINRSNLRDILAEIDPNIIPTSSSQTDIGYGAVVFVKSYLDNGSGGYNALTKETIHNTYSAITVPAVKIFDTLMDQSVRKEDSLYFTCVLTGIGLANYKIDFVVRPYITYKDAFGAKQTVYGEEYSTNVYAVAQYILANSTIQADKDVAQTLINEYDAAYPS